MPDERAARLARNEARFREINERVERDLAPIVDPHDEQLPFVCECAQRTCNATIELSLAEYERVRAESTLFAVAPGHEVPDVEDVAERHGVAQPVQMTVATSDGETLWAFRYSSVRRTRTLFYSTDVVQLRELHPEVEVLSRLSDDTRLVVSEPLRDLEGAWNEVPESSCGIVRPGDDTIVAFKPRRQT